MNAKAHALLAFVSGIVFSVGLCFSGMTRQSKVLGFLNVKGDWDPSLLFVMAGAVGVHAIAWQIARRSKAPVLGGSFPEKVAPKLDARLLGGAALFGAGWGLGGFCPGPALVSLGTGAVAPLVFCVAMAIGMLVAAPRKSAAAAAATEAEEEAALGSDTSA
jgi:uncharacterized membrane protein YedE/YeeE